MGERDEFHPQVTNWAVHCAPLSFSQGSNLLRREALGGGRITCLGWDTSPGNRKPRVSMHKLQGGSGGGGGDFRLSLREPL